MIRTLSAAPRSAADASSAATPTSLIAALKKSDPLFGERIPGTAPVLARYAKLLEPAAGEQVVGKVMPSDSGELRVVFQPARMPPSVAEVRFIKNNVICKTFRHAQT